MKNDVKKSVKNGVKTNVGKRVAVAHVYGAARIPTKLFTSFFTGSFTVFFTPSFVTIATRHSPLATRHYHVYLEPNPDRCFSDSSGLRRLWR